MTSYSGESRGTNAVGAVLSEAPVEPPRLHEKTQCYCPVCETAVDDFLPGGVVAKRSRARCPNCGVLERHRLMVLYLRGHTPLFDGAPRRVLHVAAEPAIAAILKALPNVDYLSADLWARTLWSGWTSVISTTRWNLRCDRLFARPGAHP